MKKQTPKEEWHIASVSFGKDSLAMLLLILEHPDKYPLDEVVFFDWGMEFDSIYNNRDKIIPILQKKEIKFTQLTYGTSFLYNFKEKLVHKKDGSVQFGYGWCGGRTRWGTDRKKQTIRKYYRSLQNKYVIEYIGIAADETLRIDRALANGQILPLVEYNMTEKDALNLCYNRGFHWYEAGGGGQVELYDILDRVSCWCCKNKNLKELRNIYHYLPNYWKKLEELQSYTKYPYKEYTYKRCFCGYIDDLAARFDDEDNQIRKKD